MYMMALNMRIGGTRQKKSRSYNNIHTHQTRRRCREKLTHLASVRLAEILPYAAAVGEDDVPVGIQFVRELAAAPVLVDDGLDALERLWIRWHARDGDAPPPAGDGEYFGTLLQEAPDCFDLEDSIIFFVFSFFFRQ